MTRELQNHSIDQQVYKVNIANVFTKQLLYKRQIYILEQFRYYDMSMPMQLYTNYFLAPQIYSYIKDVFQSTFCSLLTCICSLKSSSFMLHSHTRIYRFLQTVYFRCSFSVKVSCKKFKLQNHFHQKLMHFYFFF